MAAASEAALGNMVLKAQLGNKLMLALGVAAVVAVMAVFWLWSQQPDYRVLFSNYTDKDGGAIVAGLEQMNIPYKFTDGGSAILVPANQVHEARLKLAAQGLPKGGNIGFELLENQKFGVSQFVEQVNFQRGLEGELERSIQSIAAVEVARIHLAIPKSSVFVRDQQKPTASVLLNLHAGRSLDQRQVSAIVHLVASSVPELPATNVTVVDQNGTLLSDAKNPDAVDKLDPSQLKYVDELQRSVAKRVESIIAPIVGADNVRAEANAEVDFSTLEQAAETYKPNQSPDVAVVRSMQSNESQSGSSASATASGVPGALSNQPPAPSTAPIAGAPAATQPAAAAAATPTNTQKNVTTNYEVDKTVRYSQQSMGGVKKLSVAVVINHKRVVDANGKASDRPLTEAEKTQITDLAKQAMGFDKERGDSLTVVNSAFATTPKEEVAELPLWKQDGVIEGAKSAGRFAVGIAVMLLVYLRILKPLLRRLSQPMTAQALLPAQGDDGSVVNIGATPETSKAPRQLGNRGYQQNLDSAKQLAKENPKVVASVVTNWVSNND